MGQTMCHTIMKFCMPGLDLNMYLHEKFHWPVINHFFQSILNFFWKISHFSSISFFDKDRVHIDTGFENLFSMSKFIEMQIFSKVQWLWKSKLLLNMKLGVQNFAFFNILRHLVLLWPSALGQWPQILHTSYQAPGASFCKIFIHKSKAIEVF